MYQRESKVTGQGTSGNLIKTEEHLELRTSMPKFPQLYVVNYKLLKKRLFQDHVTPTSCDQVITTLPWCLGHQDLHKGNLLRAI